MTVDITSLPYFQYIIEWYCVGARARGASEDQVAQLRSKYEAFIRLAAGQRTWVLWGASSQRAVRDDVLQVMKAHLEIAVQKGESMINGYHTEGYLHEAAVLFRDLLVAAPATGSKLFLCPGDFGPEFVGERPEAFTPCDCISPVHHEPTTRGRLMIFCGTRGVLLAPHGDGGDAEYALHREDQQAAAWNQLTPFLDWPRDRLPKRFLLDTRLGSGADHQWYFDANLAKFHSKTQVGALYRHDLEGVREMIIRVTGRTKIGEMRGIPVCEFATSEAAAQFIHDQ